MARCIARNASLPPMSGRARRVGGVTAAFVGAVTLGLAMAPMAVGPILPPQSPVAVASPTARPAPSEEIPRPSHEQGVSGGRSAPPELLPLPEASAAELQAAVDRARATYGLDVLVVGVSVDATRGWSGGSGTAPDGRTRLTGDDPFAIASVTKTFTATVVLQLVEEGRLSLDDPVSDYLPDVAQVRGVTVRQLLSHTSGVADLLAPMRRALNADTRRLWTPAEVLTFIGPSVFAPGTDWGYSNTNFILLGMVVEAITGHPFGDELARRALEPLELSEAGVLATPDAPWLFSESWASAFWTAGGMYASADDLLRWGDALYGGWMLRSATLQAMLTFNADDYGLGAERYDVGGEVGYGHSGLLLGFTTLLMHLPGERVTISLVATDRSFTPTDLLAWRAPGQPSILDLALEAAAPTG